MPAPSRSTPLPPGALAFAGHPRFILLRTGLRVLEKLAPAWTPWLAAQVFCASLFTRRPGGPVTPPPGVRLQTLRFEKHALMLYHWPASADAPQVMLVHGWAGWGLQMSALADSLSRAGWAPVLIDMPGHGRSGGRGSLPTQFVRALTFVAGQLPRVRAAVGHSLGGGALCLAAARGLAVRRLVLMSSLLALERATQDYAQAFCLSEATRRGMIDHFERRENCRMAQLSLQHNASAVTLPVLVVHDENDRVVPCASALSLVEQLPDARLLATQGLGHRRVLTDPGVRAAVVDFLAPVRDMPDKLAREKPAS